MLERLGVIKVLESFENRKHSKLAIWQIIARVIDHGSVLNSIRLAKTHSACNVVEIEESFNEDDLYDNLKWLSSIQREAEKKLFDIRHNKNNELFLYDITSSYLEGEHNAFVQYGYNRDKKEGKKQIVVGLLCNFEGEPLSVEVFETNTRDFNTVQNQIQKLAGDFGCNRVTFVGDRGMVKSAQVKELSDKGFYYISAITKPEIEKLINENVFQIELFDENLHEVEYNSIRYILKKNPYRANEIKQSRQKKRTYIEAHVLKKNEYLKAHPKANPQKALECIQEKIEHLNASYLSVVLEDKMLILKQDNNALEKLELLDGCYCLKTNVPDTPKQIIHDRYKDLTFVEEAFRTCKTNLLELRPWFVRTKESTKAHAFIVNLAYLVVFHLKKAWSKFDITVEEALKELSKICTFQTRIGGPLIIPNPNELSSNLLNALNIKLPKTIKDSDVVVDSRKKLQYRRKR